MGGGAIILSACRMEEGDDDIPHGGGLGGRATVGHTKKRIELIFPDSKLGSLAKTMLVDKCLQYDRRPSACSCTEELSVCFDR